MTRHALGMLAAACLILAVAGDAEAATFTAFQSQTVAELNDAAPATGSFAGANLFVRERGDELSPQLEVRAFVQFDLTGLGAQPIQRASLKLHEYDKLNSIYSAALFAARVTAPWTPGTNDPTYNHPVDGAGEFTFGNNGPATAGPAVDISFDVDVTPWARGWQSGALANEGVRLRIGDAFVAAAFTDTGADAPQLVVVQQPASPYGRRVLADAPMLYYRLDETAGTFAANHGTLGAAGDGRYVNTGSVTLGQAGPRPADGFTGIEPDNNAPDFAGTGSGRVTVPQGLLPTGDAARTIEGWFDRTGSTSQNFFSYGPNTAGQRVSITADTTSVAVAVSGHNFGVSGLGLEPGWHHVAVVLPEGATQSNQWRLFVDGVERTAEATTIAGSTKTINTVDDGSAGIGSNQGGLLDEVAVYGRGLSAESVFARTETALGMTGVRSASGQISPIAKPASIAEGQLDSNTAVFFFQEQNAHVLGAALPVDITLPGVYGADPDDRDPSGVDGSAGGPGAIPAGTAINSYYLHYDTVSTGGLTNGGTLTFDEQILGVIFETATLRSTDSLGGLGSTQGPRLIPSETYPDLLILSDDLHSVTFNFINGGANVDQVRIITAAVPEPATLLTLALGCAGSGLAARRRRRRS